MTREPFDDQNYLTLSKPSESWAIWASLVFFVLSMLLPAMGKAQNSDRGGQWGIEEVRAPNGMHGDVSRLEGR